MFECLEPYYLADTDESRMLPMRGMTAISVGHTQVRAIELSFTMSDELISNYEGSEMK